jgi:hypothetical protein
MLFKLSYFLLLYKKKILNIEQAISYEKLRILVRNQQNSKIRPHKYQDK